MDPKPDTIRQAGEAAAASGHTDVLRIMLANNTWPTISSILKAIKNGRLSVRELLLGSNHHLRPQSKIMSRGTRGCSNGSENSPGRSICTAPTERTQRHNRH